MSTNMNSSLSRTLRLNPQILNPKHLHHKQLRTHPPIQQQQQQQPPLFNQFSQTDLLENNLISLLNNSTHINHIKQAHAHLIRHYLNQSSYLLNKLIRSLTRLYIPMDPYPRLIFDQVKYPNPFLYTALIKGYSIQGQLVKSTALYNAMRRKGTGPVSFTFTALFKACGEVTDVNLGMQIHCQIISLGGYCSDLFVGNTMIDMYVKCGVLDCGRKVFDDMADRDVISWTTMIVGYAKIGNMVAARELFEGMPLKDMVAWTAMVTGFSQNGMPREALKFFEWMERAGVETDEVTLVGVISACAQMGAIKYAGWIRDVAEKSGFFHTNNVLVGSALVDMYSKCGCIDQAYKVFEGMRIRNVFSYSSMIVGFAIHGRASAAIKLFEDMVKTEIKPNRVTFVGVLTACSHGGLVEQGEHYFAMMEKCYGVTPLADHYACMVDLLGRAGRLEEAFDLVKTMPMEPNVVVWGALLGACRIYRNPDIAEIAADRLFELEPNEVGNYMLLSNIYASAGRWEDVARVKKLMRTKGLKKNPACSWVEGKKGVIHEFFSGDINEHPNAVDIKQSLGDLLNRLKLNGYEPNLGSVPYDVNDDVKKEILMTHSEKIALACGLLNTSDSGIIRIAKNLRICEDCHMFMCGASQITGREIVVRDNMRFHHFSNGICSCGNYW